MKWMSLAPLLLAGGLFLPGQEKAQPTGPEVGKPAPTFRVNGHDGKAVSVGKNEDGLWTVLAFYPKAATPG